MKMKILTNLKNINNKIFYYSLVLLRDPLLLLFLTIIMYIILFTLFNFSLSNYNILLCDDGALTQDTQQLGGSSNKEDYISDSDLRAKYDKDISA
jgi:hypothetical protein